MSALVPSTGRKAEHLRLAAGPGAEHRTGSGLAGVRLRHRALPGRDLDAVDLTTDLLGARLAAPLVVRDPAAGAVAQAFADFGVPTADAVAQARAAAPALPLIASGGVRDGVDVARCLALGANAAGLARPLLIAAQQDRAGEAVAVLVRRLRIATWTAGAAQSGDLGAEHLR